MRVRHLQSISLRNYESALELPIASASSELLYFSLHVTRDERGDYCLVLIVSMFQLHCIIDLYNKWHALCKLQNL